MTSTYCSFFLRALPKNYHRPQKKHRLVGTFCNSGRDRLRHYFALHLNANLANNKFRYPSRELACFFSLHLAGVESATINVIVWLWVALATIVCTVVTKATQRQITTQTIRFQILRLYSLQYFKMAGQLTLWIPAITKCSSLETDKAPGKISSCRRKHAPHVFSLCSP